MTLIKFAKSSEEARIEMRVTVIKEMIQMHNSKRRQQKLIDVYRFIERYEKNDTICLNSHFGQMYSIYEMNVNS